MSISLIVLLWLCGSVMLLATAASHDGFVRIEGIYFSLIVGPLGLLIGPSEGLLSLLPDSETIIWRRPE